ncbi:MAG TPA: hypothetical protein VIM59_17715, partial [Cellvibrio sp.]
NDPVNATDPTGTQCFAMTHGIGSVCAGAGLSLPAPDKSTRNPTQVAQNEIANGKETLKETAQLTATVATTVVAPELVTLKIGSLLFKGEKAADTIKVFRAFGGDARAGGFSWTTKDPRTVSNFRDAAGLPSGGASGSTNTANFLLKGEVKAGDIIESRSALPLDGNRGGLPELIIDPKNVNITDFFVLKP